VIDGRDCKDILTKRKHQPGVGRSEIVPLSQLANLLLRADEHVSFMVAAVYVSRSPHPCRGIIPPAIRTERES
jgi:hypothetical protein